MVHLIWSGQLLSLRNGAISDLSTGLYYWEIEYLSEAVPKSAFVCQSPGMTSISTSWLLCLCAIITSLEGPMKERGCHQPAGHFEYLIVQ